MAFNVQTFKNNIQSGFLKPSKFDINIQIPLGFQGQDASSFMLNTGGSLKYYCTEAHIPGLNLFIGPHRHYGYGPIYRRPHAQLPFEEMILVFNNDSQGLIWSFFNQWLNLIIPFNLDSPISNNPVGTIGGGGTLGGTAGQIYPWELSFLDDYCTVMEITQYMLTGQPSLSIQVNEVYPISLSRVRLDWSQGDAVSTFTVMFAYRDWFQIVNGPQGGAGVPDFTSGGGVPPAFTPSNPVGPGPGPVTITA